MTFSWEVNGVYTQTNFKNGLEGSHMEEVSKILGKCIC